ncbi:MAG: hypothetical protein KGL39_25670 [Patescibacteria group bacterium]|nr:hypothetical protein [Patescibacteria group bacterium]
MVPGRGGTTRGAPASVYAAATFSETTMPDGPVIIDGTHRNDPANPSTWFLGELPGPRGPIPVYRDNIIAALTEAMGEAPQPPPLMGPGTLERIEGPLCQVSEYDGTNDATQAWGTTALVYNPGSDNYNAQAVAEFQARIAEWNNRAQQLMALANLMLGQLGKSK